MLQDTVQWIFTTGIPYYIMTGMGVFVLIIISEIYTQYIRGPEYMKYLQGNMEESKGDITKTLKIILIWPLLFLVFIQAIWNGHSWAEHVIETEKELEETEEARKMKLLKELKELSKGEQLKIDGTTPYEMGYRYFDVKANQAHPHIEQGSRMCLVAAAYSGKDRVKYETITHAIMKFHNRFMVFRTIGPEGGDEGIPLKVALDFESAFNSCHKDTEWLSLCGPHTKNDRNKFMKKALERLKVKP